MVKASKLHVALTAGGIALAALAGVAVHAQGASPEQAHVQHRNAVMSGSGMAGVSLARMAGGLIEPQNVAGLARYWATGARLSADAFKADTRGSEAETRAKDAVWEDWDDFSTRMNAYAEDVAEIARVAESGDEEAALEMVVPTIREHCKDCHDKYRSD